MIETLVYTLLAIGNSLFDAFVFYVWMEYSYTQDWIS